MAGVTGLEPAASGVTGRHSNQLSYTPSQGVRFTARPEHCQATSVNTSSTVENFAAVATFGKALLQPSVGTAREKIRGVSAILLDLIFNPLRDFLFLLLVI